MRGMNVIFNPGKETQREECSSFNGGRKDFERV